MKLKVNGEDREFQSDELSISELLKACDVKMPEMVSVELNGQIIARDQYPEVAVSGGDQVEFLYFMGGGTR